MTSTIATAHFGGAPEQTAEALLAQLTAKLGGQKPALTVVFASSTRPLVPLVEAVKARLGGLVLGASSIGEFNEKTASHEGASAFALAGDYAAFGGMAEGLKEDPEGCVRRAIEPLPKEAAGLPHRTVIFMLNTQGINSEAVIDLAPRLLGERVRLAGGGASDVFGPNICPQMCLDGRVVTDGLVFVALFSREPVGVGVHHGHHPFTRPIKVTRAKDNQVATLNGRPAWEVWKEQTREHAKRNGLDPDKLALPETLMYLIRYEAALGSGSELKIRAPLGVGPHKELIFSGQIPEGADLRITESIADRQISSARAAARLARLQMGNTRCAGALVFDCVCRRLILGNNFETAVRGISEELDGAPLAGLESFGEIALDVGESSGFHNSSTVVLSFPA